MGGVLVRWAELSKFEIETVSSLTIYFLELKFA